jgi:hypothetical protein
MCNLYSMTKGQQAILDLSRAMSDRTELHPVSRTPSQATSACLSKSTGLR